jgi:hypothetical protein
LRRFSDESVFSGNSAELLLFFLKFHAMPVLTGAEELFFTVAAWSSKYWHGMAFLRTTSAQQSCQKKRFHLKISSIWLLKSCFLIIYMNISA